MSDTEAAARAMAAIPGKRFGTPAEFGQACFGVGTAGTVFVKSGSGLAIYVEPSRVAAR